MSAAAIPVGDGSVRAALAGTGLGLSVRWRALSGRAGRTGAWVGLIVGLVALMGASGLGASVRAFAQDDTSTAAGIYARSYLTQWASDGFGSLAAGVVVFVAAVTVVAPLISPVSPGLIATSDRAGFPLARMSRYTDSIVTYVLSLTTALQVLALTALASLVCIDGAHRVRALIIVWAGWGVSVLFAVAAGWSIELVRRTRPGVVRWLLGALALAAGGAVGLDPHHGTTVFGAGPHLTDALRTDPIAAVVAVVAGAGAGCAVWGWVACRAALARPEQAGAVRRVRARALPTGMRRAVAAVTWRTLMRTPVVRTPVLTVLVGAFGAATLAGPSPRVIAALMVTAPLMLALAWPVNSLVLLTGSAAWLASLPGASRAVLGVHAALGWALTFTATTLVWVGAAARGTVDARTAATIVALGVATSTCYTALAVHLAMTRPRPAVLEAGQPVLPPARTIALTVSFLVTLGLGTAAAVGGGDLTGATGLPWGLTVTWCALATVLGGAWLGGELAFWSSHPDFRSGALSGADR